jgi:membrane associated rhomboid family serine protease
MIQNHQVRARDHLFPEGGAGWIEARNDPTFGKLFSEPPLGLAQFKVPWLTLSILVVLIVIFLLENASDPSALTPSVATLVAFGALSHKLVFSDGEWFRLFTAPLLHANFPHILGNGVALVLGGWILERLVGRLWFFAFFTVGALGGSLVSAAVNPVNQVSVGASGALMGMFAALFVSAFRFPFGTAARTSLVLNSLRILVPSLLPFFPAAGGGRIDYGAHVGGMLSGGIMALLLLMCWPEGAHSATSTGCSRRFSARRSFICNERRFGDRPPSAIRSVVSAKGRLGGSRPQTRRLRFPMGQAESARSRLVPQISAKMHV